MSRPSSNQQQFRYTIQQASDDYSYDNHGHHGLQDSSGYWPPTLSTGSRNILSPSVSIGSDLGGVHRPSVSPIDSSIDPSLYLNSISSTGHVPRATYENLGQNYRDEESWNPFNLRTSSSDDDRSRLNPVSSSFKTYRNGPGSVGSAAHVSDSGFFSQSAISNDPGRANQELPSNLTSQVDNMHVSLETSEFAPVPSDQRSHASSVSGRQGKRIQCPECPEVSKCMSDYKKHELRHKKPFTCLEPGCKRQGQGFTTVNDLDRHKKSVHRVGLLKKSYQCASDLCRNKEKIWPRLDNFKQHIERMHKGEDSIDLIKRSVYVPQIPQTIAENDVVAPMETMLVGMDKPFPSSDGYAYLSQDLSSWSTGMPIDNSTSQQSTLSSNIAHLNRGSNNSVSRLTPGRSSICKPSRQEPSSQRASFSSANEGINSNSITPPIERHTSSQRPRSQPKISRDPQTKVQQQRQALQKFSKAVGIVSSGSDNNSVDLEASIVRILAATTSSNDVGGGSQSSGDASTISKNDALRAAQAITNLIKQNAGPTASQQHRSRQGSLSEPKVCTVCGHTVSRACDMRKHMMRHDKPYGCTYPKCQKRFGAKSDWKRHENSQHFQLEAYRCRRRDLNNESCGQHFFQAAQFDKHLQYIHGMVSPDHRAEEVKQRKIGKNCQGRFWCGFCNEIIELKTRRNEAWDERFDHIADHFQKEKRRIEDWICAEENRKKGDSFQDADRNSCDEEEERPFKPHPQSDSRPPDHIPQHTPPPPPFQPPPPPELTGSQEAFMITKRKRLNKGPLEGIRDRKKSRFPVTICCNCHNQLDMFGNSCTNMNCSHKQCSQCILEA